MSFTEISDAETDFFTVKKLSDGIFATFTKPNVAVGGNSMIVDLGGKTFIFDTFMSLKPAVELLKTAEKLTGNTYFIIGNSHFHFDHVRGNQVFPDDSIVIASTQTRELMTTRSVQEIEKNKKNWPVELQKEKEKLETEQDPKKKEELQANISFYDLLTKELPDLHIRLPDISFDSKLIYHGKKRNVELITFGGAHTPSDVILYLPAEKIIHAGDVILNKNHFFMDDGLPLNWNNILIKISELDFTTLVPGHGMIGGKELIEIAQSYINALKELANECIINNYSDEKIASITPPEPFNSWDGDPDSFTSNIKTMKTALLQKK